MANSLSTRIRVYAPLCLAAIFPALPSPSCIFVCQSQLAEIYNEFVMPVHYSLFMGMNEVNKTLFYRNPSVRYTDMLNYSTLLLLMTSGLQLNKNQKIFFIPCFRNVFTSNLVAQPASKLILNFIRQVQNRCCALISVSVLCLIYCLIPRKTLTLGPPFFIVLYNSCNRPLRPIRL